MAEQKNKTGESTKSYTTLLGLVRRKRKPNGTWVFQILWGRVIAAFAVLVVVLWTLGAGAMYAYFKYRLGYDEMTFAKAYTVPFNMTEIRRSMGDYNIEEAKRLLKEQNIGEAYFHLSAGVSRSPRNIEGRQLLSELSMLIYRNPDRSIGIMDAGLIYGVNDINFMRSYIRMLLDNTEDAKLIRVGERLLKDEMLTNADVKNYIAMALSTVYALHGNYEKSKQYLVDYGLDKTVPGITRLSKNEWEQGKRDEAIQVIADNFNYARKKEPLYALLVKYYTAMQDYDKARQYSMLRSIEDPFSLEQRMEYLRLLKKSNDEEDMRRDLELLFTQYSKNNRGMLHLANFAADIGDLPLMQRIYDIAVRNNFPIAPYCLLLLETMLTNGDYKAATDFAEEILKDRPPWIRRFEDVLTCLRAIAYYGTGNPNMADLMLSEVLKRNTATPKVLIATARRLEDMGAIGPAHKLLENAVERFPRHQLALTRLVQIEIKIGNSTNLDRHLFNLLNMRRPPRELIEDARMKLVSDRFIFTGDRKKVMGEIDALMQNTIEKDKAVPTMDVGGDRMLEGESSSSFDI